MRVPSSSECPSRKLMCPVCGRGGGDERGGGCGRTTEEGSSRALVPESLVPESWPLTRWDVDFLACEDTGKCTDCWGARTKGLETDHQGDARDLVHWDIRDARTSLYLDATGVRDFKEWTQDQPRSSRQEQNSQRSLAPFSGINTSTRPGIHWPSKHRHNIPPRPGQWTRAETGGVTAATETETETAGIEEEIETMAEEATGISREGAAVVALTGRLVLEADVS